MVLSVCEGARVREADGSLCGRARSNEVQRLGVLGAPQVPQGALLCAFPRAEEGHDRVALQGAAD